MVCNAGDRGSIPWSGRSSCGENGSSVQFSHSVISDSLDPIDHSMPGLPVHHQLPEFTQTYVHHVGDAIQPSVVPFSSHLQSFPASGSFQMSQFFASDGQGFGFSFNISPFNEYSGLFCLRMH